MCENDFKDVVVSQFRRSHVGCNEAETVFGYFFPYRHRRQRDAQRRAQRKMSRWPIHSLRKMAEDLGMRCLKKNDSG